ncbi:hypothetical protein S675_005449 [Salmonella enterica subsp. enterica]|nr:hypothetical protein [Salmonella enterica subsp. enterica]
MQQSVQIAAHGRLIANPDNRQGIRMTFGRLAVTLPCHTAEAGEVTLWITVIAFGRQSDALAK